MRKLEVNLILTLTLSSILVAGVLAQTRDRESIPAKYTWDLSDLYPSDEAWSKAKAELDGSVEKLEQFKGTLGNSASQLLACLEFTSQWGKEYQRFRSYASNRSSQDTRDSKYVALEQEAAQLATKFNAAASFIEPEIVAIPESKLRGFIEELPGLKPHAFRLMDLMRTKEHTLSEKEERLMAEAGRMARAASSIYSIFSNAEFPYPETLLSDGKTVKLDKAGFSLFRALPVREDREKIFQSFFGAFENFKGTFGAQMFAKVNRDWFYARARGYPTALESALDANNIPVGVYESLIENVGRNLDKFHRFLKIKQRMLQVDKLEYSDLYAPTVKGVDLKYDVEEAKKLVLESLEPLGPDYVNAVQSAFDKRWIDFYPTPGKRSGAYSSDGGYEVHPLILMNYNGRYDDMSTLTHELGHAVHSYMANKSQPYPLADYSIFVAEVASTFNEALLLDRVLKTINDDDTRLSLLMEYLDGIKGTLFRQTQFAEFEWRLHQMVEKGETLTGDNITELYRDVVRKYYGHDQGVCDVQDVINIEWAYIPHFMGYTYYVYQYATSFTASTALAEKVIRGDEGAVDQYLKFLSAGGSAYPIDLLKQAGVDMTTAAPFDNTMRAMSRIMDEVEAVLARKGL